MATLSEIFDLLLYSSQAVSTIFIIAAIGAFLVRFKVVTTNFLDNLGKIIFRVMLPCLLFSSVAGFLSFEKIQKFWFLPLAFVIYMLIGGSLGYLALKIVKPPKQYRNALIVSNAFANSGYLPIPLISAIIFIFPHFKELGISHEVGVSFVSMYLVAFSPMMWSVGYNVMSAQKKKFKLTDGITPPVIGVFLGVIVAMIPKLQNCLCSQDGELFFLFNTVKVIAGGTIPCVLLILGGKLAYGPKVKAIGAKTVLSVIVTKLIILPSIALAGLFFLHHIKMISLSPVLLLVLVIEAAVPPANNLIVICSMTNRKIEEGMAGLLFWTYLAAVPLLTFFIMLAMWLTNKL